MEIKIYKFKKDMNNKLPWGSGLQYADCILWITVNTLPLHKEVAWEWH